MNAHLGITGRETKPQSVAVRGDPGKDTAFRTRANLRRGTGVPWSQAAFLAAVFAAFFAALFLTAFAGAGLGAPSISRLSAVMPRFFKACTNHNGRLPRPDHVWVAFSGLRYFGATTDLGALAPLPPRVGYTSAKVKLLLFSKRSIFSRTSLT